MRAGEPGHRAGERRRGVADRQRGEADGAHRRLGRAGGAQPQARAGAREHEGRHRHDRPGEPGQRVLAAKEWRRARDASTPGMSKRGSIATPGGLKVPETP